MKKLPITAIVLTYNEELNLPHCLENLKGNVDEIIVVDSYSEDDTLEIAEEYGARIVQHPFETYDKQLNWALDNLEVNNEWILEIDADEWLTQELWNEIGEKLPETPEEVTGYFMKRRVYFMGSWIKYGGYYPTWILRLFRYGKARMESREMDENTELLEGRAEHLENDFVDDNKKDLSWWVDKHNGYATREAKAILSDKEKEEDPDLGGGQVQRKRWLKENVYLKTPKFIRAFLYFIYRYIFRLGFLDGMKGLIFHFLQGFWYRFLVDAKLYEIENKNN